MVARQNPTLQLENLALRHQLGVMHRSVKKPKLTPFDRLLWAWLCGVWAEWSSALIVVKPATAIAWHRKGFRLFWTRKVRYGQHGRLPNRASVHGSRHQCPHWRRCEQDFGGVVEA
jgi:putative transposase